MHVNKLGGGDEPVVLLTLPKEKELNGKNWNYYSMERRNTHTVFVEPVPYRTKLFTQLNHVCFIVSRVVLVIAYNLVNVIIFLNKGCEEDFFEYGESSRRTICSCAQSRSHEYHILYCCKNATNCNDNFVPQFVIIIYYYD